MVGSGRIDAKVSREYQAVIFAMKAMPTELRKQVRQHVKQIGQPAWQKAMAEQISTRLEQRVLVDTARLTPSDQNVRLSSATVGRSLAGGLNPKTNFAGVEFGADRSKRTAFTQTSVKGRPFQVRNKRTQAQLRPRRRSGYVFYPAAAGIIPKFAALFAQTVVRTVAEGLEARNG